MNLIPLPATPEVVLSQVFEPALEYLPAKFRGVPAKVEMLSITQQESGLKYRIQQPNGPAKGLFQFEMGGGVKGVMTHPASMILANNACKALGVPWTQRDVYDALQFNDYLAVIFARLLLWTNPKPLPTLGDVQAAWDYYEGTWHPGKPHRDTWDAYYAKAVKAVAG